MPKSGLTAGASRAARAALIAASPLLALGAARAQQPAAAAAPGIPLGRCEDLAGLTVPATAIGMPTGGATVASAVRAPVAGPIPDPDGERGLPLPERCILQGSIAPVSPAAPPIGFAINLPLAWNGIALQSGGGGMGGAVIAAPEQKASARFDPIPLDRPYPITLGYATFGSDGGHTGTDVAFMASDEAMRNWGGDSMKKTRDVALEILRAAYGQPARRVYFNGESAGAREALFVAQRFPEDYDGVIATSPVLSWNYIHLADNNTRSRLIRGWLDAPAIRLLAERTRASCDAEDGLRDGVVARYLECRNDVASLRCADGQRGEGCLSDAQIAAVNAVREPWSMAVPLAYGVTRYPGYGVTGGEDAERYQYAFYPVGTEPPTLPLPPGRGTERNRGATLNFAVLWVRHAIAQDAAFEPDLFDPRPYAARLQYLSTMFDATDPDLSRFRRHGGKLILLQPSADNAVGTPMVAEYYRSVVAAMGQAAADETMRFYVGHGGGHNVTGASQVDTLTLLENWVEKGEAPPDSVTAYDIDTVTLRTLRTLPACRYPAYARYDGHGDRDDARSFTCVGRPDPLGFHAQ